MSQTNAQLRSLEELDARVDALVNEIGASTASVQAALPEAVGSSELSPDDTDLDAPPPPSAVDPAAGAGSRPAFTFDDSDFSSAEAVLQEVSAEIQPQTQSPVSMTASPPDLAASRASDEARGVDAAGAAGARATVPDTKSLESELSSSSLDAVLADAAGELAAAPVAAPEISAASPGAPTPPTPSAPSTPEPPPSLHEQVTHAVAVASDEHPETETSDDIKLATLESAAAEAPVADIEQLDQALAANADKALADAQRELDDLAAAEGSAQSESAPIAAAAPEIPAPQPEPPPTVEPSPASPASAPAPVAKPATAPALAPKVEPLADEPPGTRPSRAGALAAMLLAPLRPIAALHEKLSEQARQTIAYIAIMNVFFASVVWFFAVQKPVTQDPVSHGTHAFHSDEEALAAKAAAERAHAAHGEEGGDHAAHDDRAHPPAKSSGHGASDHKADDGHGAKKAETKKAASSKSTKKKTDAKAAAHGGH